MNGRFLISKDEIGKILEEEKNSFLKEILKLKQESIEKTCRQNLIEPNPENFFKSYPENYIKILKRAFENLPPKTFIKNYLLKLIREENFPEDFREKAKELEEYFLYDFMEKNLDNLFLSFYNYYYEEKEEEIKLSPYFEKIKGLFGEKKIRQKVEELIERINYKVNEKEIWQIFNRFEINLEQNFFKVKDKIEIPPLLILQMGLNSLNVRYPHLFKNLTEEKEKELKDSFLKLKSKGLVLCVLYSLAKFFYNEELRGIEIKKLSEVEKMDLNSFSEKFFMGMELNIPIDVKDINIIKKGFVFKKILLDKDFKILKEAEDLFEEDEIFFNICKEKVLKEYEDFVNREIFKLIEEDKNIVFILRNLFFSPAFFSHNEIIPLYKLKEYFIYFLDSEDLIKPFQNYEKEILSNIKESIFKLKQNFSRIDINSFKSEALKIFEKISTYLLLWEDYGEMLEEFSKEFMHLQIPEEVSENFSRLSYNYLSVLLDGANFYDFPEDANPQFLLFEALKEAKEKGKILSLANYLKNPISYKEWEELLFSFKLSTSYRDFYDYIKGFVKSKGALLLIKVVLETLQREDIDLSISQRIFQELSFMPEIEEKELFNLLLQEDNFYLYKKDLKEKIFGIYPFLDDNLKNIIKRKGFYTEVLEIEYTRKEKAFLNFLQELNLSRSYISFNDYIKVSKSYYKREEKLNWEELFIPVKHYLIQIEPLKDGFFITLNLSGRREGPHPFEGLRIKTYKTKDPEEISWVLSFFQKYTSFLLDLEEELFEFEYKEQKKVQKYKIKTKRTDRVIFFKRKNGKFLSKLKMERELLKKIWAKAYAPFYASEKDETLPEEDARFLLDVLKNVLL